MNEREIYIEARQQPDDEQRTAFLNKACGHDAALRERVDALLKLELDSFLDEPAYQLHESPPSFDLRQDVGTSIGPYKLMEQIGEGGFGLVFVAEQHEPVRRNVALKLIKPGMDSKEIIARFEAERQALALMDHPNIARVLDAGTTETGRPYFVMDLVRGIPITKFCDENKLSPNERLRLFLPICRAVQHAHQKGIIHRDIKPSNLLVTMNDGEPVPKVIDFGVAKALNQRLTQHTVYTRFSQMIGTPLYMSPEQAEMSSVDVDTRSDIYSLGVLLYELLTGSTPFDRERLSQVAFDEVRRIIRDEEPLKPSTRLSQSGDRLRGLAAQRRTEPSKLSKMIRGDLDWIVMKALEKDRNRRYDTANGFAADIERYLHDQEVLARPPSTSYRLRKIVARNKTVFTTITLVATALLLGTIVSTYQAILANKAANDSRQNENRALAQQKVATEQRKRAANSEADMRERVYATEMNQASLALAEDEVYLMRNLLNEHRPIASDDVDLRGFEWYLLWRAGHLSKKWVRNTNRLRFQDLAVSPDGKTLAAVDWVGETVHVYDSDSLNLICSPLSIANRNAELRFSPDGRFLIAADEGRTRICLVDTETWEQTVTLDSAPSCAIAVAQDKPLMATAGLGEIMLWDTTSWTHTESLPIKGQVVHLALNPDGTKLVCALGTELSGWVWHGPIQIWDLARHKVVRTLESREWREAQDDEIVFSPDGRLLAIGDQESVVRIWSVDDLFGVGDDPKPIHTFHAPSAVGSLAFSPDSKRLAVVSAEDESSATTANAVQVLEVGPDRYELIPTFMEHSAHVADVSFVRDVNTICTIGYDGTLKLWDLRDSRLYDIIDGVESKSLPGYAVNGTLIYQDMEGSIRGWNVAARQSRTMFDTKQRFSRTAISSDGSVLAGISRDEKRLLVFSLSNEDKLCDSALDLELFRRRVAARGGLRDGVIISRLAVSNDGRHVACVLPLREEGPLPALVVLIDSETGKLIDEATFLTDAEISPVFSPSGRQLVTQKYFDYFSMVSDVTPGALVPRLRILGQGLQTCAAISPDGSLLATGNHHNEIQLVDLTQGKSVQSLKGHTKFLTGIAYSRDGQHLVSGALDGTLRIWKRGRTGYRLASTLRSHLDSHVLGVAVSPGGNSIAALNGDLRAWAEGFPHYERNEAIIQVWRTATSGDVQQSNDDQLLVLPRPTTSWNVRLKTEVRLLDEALARSSNNLQALEGRARRHYQLGDWESAKNDWTKSLQQDPENHYFLESRAKAYVLGQQWPDAWNDWNQLVRLTNESNGRYLLGRGVCYLYRGHQQDAHADLVAALSQSANLETIERAISFLEFAEPVFPTESQWRYLLGTRAPPAWESISFDDHDWSIGWAPFGTIQRERGITTRTDAGYQDIWLRRSFTLDREMDAPMVLHLRAVHDVEVYINGVSAIPDGSNVNYEREPRGADRYRRLYPVVPCSKAVRLSAGKNVVAVRCRNRRDGHPFVDVGLYVRNDDANTESMLSAAANRAPKNATLLTAMAIRYTERRKWNDAAVCFHKAARVSPTSQLPTWMWAALMYRHGGDMEQYHELVGEIVEQFKSTNSGSRAGMLALACLLAEPTAANESGIEELVNRAWELAPDSSMAKFARALLAYRTGDPDAAIDWAQKCPASDRRVAGILALVYADMGKFELAREQMANMTTARDSQRFHLALRQNDEAHEEAFVQILLDEAKQKLSVD